MIENSLLYLLKHYFKLFIYFASNFGIFCFTTQCALAQTPSLTPNYERAINDEALLTATEYNIATSETNVSTALEPISVSATQVVQDHEIAGSQARTVLTAASTQQVVTSVSQLTDVQPTDWAFQALQSLVERYAIIVGYPNAGRIRCSKKKIRIIQTNEFNIKDGRFLNSIIAGDKRFSGIPR